MRNLGDYPITDAEIVAALQRLQDDLRGDDLKVGDIRPLLLDCAIERIASHPWRPARMAANRSLAADRAKRRGWLGWLRR